MDLDFQPENLPPKPAPKPNASPTEPMVSAQPVNPIPAPSMPPAPQPTPESTPVANIATARPGESPSSPPAPSQPLMPPKSKGSKTPLIIGLILLIIALGVGGAVWFLQNRNKSQQSTDLNSTSTLGSDLTSISTSQPTAGETLPGSNTASSRDAKRKDDLRKIDSLVAAYFVDNNAYPISNGLDKLNITDSVVKAALVPKYAALIPVDPLDPDFFYGYSSSDGKGYELSARLEDSSDTQAELVGSKYLFIIKK